jgi:hypothetical protein
MTFFGENSLNPCRLWEKDPLALLRTLVSFRSIPLEIAWKTSLFKIKDNAMESGGLSSGSAPHPVALAFAVAALQQANHAMTADAHREEALLKAATASLLLAANQHEVNPASTPSLATKGYKAGGAVRSPFTEQCAGSGSGEGTNESEGAADAAAARLRRSRERNREHARRTRLRKKARLQALKSKCKGLEAERIVLRQRIEECSIASILLGLSSSSDVTEDTATLLTKEPQRDEASTALLAGLGGKSRKRGYSVSDQSLQQQPALHICIDGEDLTVYSNGNSSTERGNVNWKTGLYVDEQGRQRQLTNEQLDALRYVAVEIEDELWSRRVGTFFSVDVCIITHMSCSFIIHSFSRERNRMHAKMTRDRKKCFIATMEKTIEDLEKECERMRNILAKVAPTTAAGTAQTVSPLTSPELAAVQAPVSDGEETTLGIADNSEESLDGSSAPARDAKSLPPKKRARHGFSLDEH